jgi:hypothetical protein
MGVGGTGAGGGQGGSLGSVGNISGLGAGYQSLRQGASSTKVLDVPLSWTIRSEIDPQRMLIFSAPLAQADVDGAKVNYYGLGVGYRMPVNSSWSLTPSLHYGGMSSSELNVKSSLVNVALTSAYTIDLADEAKFVIRNMAGYYTTLSYTSLGAGTDDKISNTIIKNGVLYSRPAAMRNVRFAVEYSIVDTRLFGTETFNRGYTEFGVAVASRQSETSRDIVRFGASYLYSQTSKGLGVNFGYWF